MTSCGSGWQRVECTRNTIGWSEGEVVGRSDGSGAGPELTKWSVHLGLAIVLTRKGYKEHHWLVVPHQPLQLTLLHITAIQCLLLLALSPAPSTISALAVPLFVFAVKLAIVPMLVGPSPPSCSTRKHIEWVPLLSSFLTGGRGGVTQGVNWEFIESL